MNDSWKRKPRRNGDNAVYVNIPRHFIDALGMSFEEFWNSKVEFRIEDGKAVIELKR